MIPDARQMAAMMRRMGIETKDVDAEEVVVRTKDAEYRFRRPQVSVIKAQGQETWQVVGKAERTARPGAGAAGEAPAPAQPSPKADLPAPSAPTQAEDVAELPASDEDVKLVAAQSGRSLQEARAALEATKGDLAEAILRLGAK